MERESGIPSPPPPPPQGSVHGAGAPASPPPCRILHLEDNPCDAELIQNALRTQGLVCHCVRVHDRHAFVAALDLGSFDLILADQSLPSFDGLSALDLARAKCPQTPFIFLS